MCKISGQKSQNCPKNRAKHLFHTCQHPALIPNKYKSLKNLNISSERLTFSNFLCFIAFMTSKRLHPGPLGPREADYHQQSNKVVPCLASKAKVAFSMKFPNM